MGAVGLSTAVAGCQNSTETPTPTPTPAESVLHIRVENETDTQRDVSFQLDVTASGPDNTYLFHVADIEPGTTRRTSRELEGGSYELRVTIGGDGTTIRWSGNECSEKLVVIRFTETGTVISDRCPGNA